MQGQSPGGAESGAPTGDVTLVFTDIEGSDARWSADLQGTRALIALHAAVIRAATAEFGGYEVKTSGDGFMLAFARPEDAAAFCARALDALSKVELRIRLGAHRGAPLCLTDPTTGRMDYYGPPANKAARLRDAAHPGQALFSDEARSGEGGVWVDLGEHVLRGIEGRHRLWQLGADQHPRPRTVELRLTNLPARPDSFVGRDHELDRLRELLGAGERLVTLLGPGGAGKTRLSQRIAAELLGDRVESAWFCDLSEARTLDGVIGAVASTLELPPAKDAARAVGWAIAGRGAVLVVLDNFEQAVDHAAASVGVWARMAPEAIFLVTSRIPVRLRGERTVELASMRTTDGIKLLVDRGFEVDPDAPETAELVERLDGLPLAIELAAARTRSMSVSEVLARLDRRFRLLTGGAADLPQRHRALRATLDWSWDLMTPDEREALCQLSVFEGGFTLDAAEAVLRVSGWAPDLVRGLVDQCLVQRDRSADRYHMLVSVTEYAAERGRELGGRAEAERRHGLHFARLGQPATIRALDMTEDDALRRCFRLEIDNVATACRRAISHGDGEIATATLIAAAEIIELTGPFSLGISLAAALREAPGVTPRHRLVASNLQWTFYRLSGSGELPVEDLEGVVEAARALGDRREEAVALWNLAQIYSAMGHDEPCASALDGALVCARSTDDRRLMGRILNTLGVRRWQRAQYAEALDAYREALQAHREAGSRRNEGMTLSNMGIVHQDQGRNDEASDCFQEALAMHERIGNRRSFGITLGNIGVLRREQGRFPEARAALIRALSVHREVGNQPFVTRALRTLGDLSITLGHYDDAMARYQEAMEQHRAAEDRVAEAATRCNLGELLLDLGRLDEAEQHLDAALAMARESATRGMEGAALTTLGRLRRLQGRLDEALRCCGEALSLLDGVGERRHQAATRRQLAGVYVARGELARAAEELELALDIVRASGNPQELAYALALRAEIAARAGRPVEAATALLEAEGLVQPEWPAGREIARVRGLLSSAALPGVMYAH